MSKSMDKRLKACGVETKIVKKVVKTVRRKASNPRVPIQQMETGERKLMAEELMKLMELTGYDLDYFTDPYQAIADEVQIHIDTNNRGNNEG